MMRKLQAQIDFILIQIFKGFDSNGVGPRDSGNSVGVGGNKYYTGKVEVRTRKFMPEDGN